MAWLDPSDSTIYPADYRRERDTAIALLDLVRLRVLFAKAEISVPQDDATLLIAVHKARATMDGMPEGAREESKLWLQRRGHDTRTRCPYCFQTVTGGPHLCAGVHPR